MEKRGINTLPVDTVYQLADNSIWIKLNERECILAVKSSDGHRWLGAGLGQLIPHPAQEVVVIKLPNKMG